MGLNNEAGLNSEAIGARIPAVCPMHTAEDAALEPTPAAMTQPELTPGDELAFPKHKRMFSQYRATETGARELCLFYGDSEISFDEPELFAFGEGLAKHAQFVAGAAMTWGDGYEWPRVRDLLAELVATGVLLRADGTDADAPLVRDLNRPSLMPSAPSPRARTWHDCEALTRELTGRSLEVGYLELILTPYRIAHLALDGEGRQVGEANVFPPAMRVEVPTEWRVCPHAGSRYQDPLPMNVTALKSMRAHWKPMMVGLIELRDAYLARFPQAREQWTVADLHCLSSFVLSIPSYLTMRVRDRVANGEVHPVLSSMYRVTDGVRMVMHHMLFSANLETTLPMEAPMTKTALLDFAERHRIFHSDYGVCAGPPAMIDEFIRVLVDGEPLADAASVVLDPPIRAALDAREAAFDYVLLGLQAFSVWQSRWPPMVRAYEEIATALDAWSGPTTQRFDRLRARLTRSVNFLRNATRHNTEDRREKREAVYASMYARSVGALGHETSTLAEAIAPVDEAAHASLRTELHRELQRRLIGDANGAHPALARLTDAVMGYLQLEQAIVREAARIQTRINTLLGREAPRRPLAGADLAIHHRLLGGIYKPEVLAKVDGQLPYLVDELNDELGFDIAVRSGRIDLFAH
jgi:hypothetical protein